MQFKTLPTVQVGGVVYSIKLNNTFSSSRDANNYGDYNYEKAEIRLSMQSCDGEPRPVQITEISLLHELLHAIDQAHDLDLDEKCVASLAHGLYQVLKQYGLRLIDAIDDKERPTIPIGPDFPNMGKKND